MKLISVVMSGGTSARLWPVCRQDSPKPFMSVGGSRLISQAVRRGDACGASDVIVVTGQDLFVRAQEFVAEVHASPFARYILEPSGRNTGPAIALAALACAQDHGTDAVMLVLPADHLIADMPAFTVAAAQAASLAASGQLVVFGITPTAPETGYGYVEVAMRSSRPQAATGFVEKPSLALATQFVGSARYYWNSGMFCFTAGAILSALELHAPQLLGAARAAFARSSTDGVATRFQPRDFALLPDISIDCAVMENARNISVVPATFDWSDVGTWPAIAASHTADADGNTGDVSAVLLDSRNTHVSVNSHVAKQVAIIGVSDVVIIDTPDAMLVMHKNSAGRLKEAVSILSAHHHGGAVEGGTVHRPWGSFATLLEEQTPLTGESFKVKRICVKPGQAISLQFHHHRSEHWVLVQGHGRVQIGEAVHESVPGQHWFIPKEARHRITNTGAQELVLIEVQCGAYLGEDDIVRLEDTYGRS